MFLSYFDEVKPQPDRPHFLIGGIVLDANNSIWIEEELNQLSLNFFGSALLGQSTEFHGEHIMRGRQACKGFDVQERINIFCALIDVLRNPCIHKFYVEIDTARHKAQYKHPMPEYNLGLMFFIEQIDAFLQQIGDIGMLFGDDERDQNHNAIVSLSQFRATGTHFHKGRSINNLIDTLYFARSHHSRFVQLADVFMYLMQLSKYDTRNKNMQNAVLSYFDQTDMQAQLTRKVWP